MNNCRIQTNSAHHINSLYELIQDRVNKYIAVEKLSVALWTEHQDRLDFIYVRELDNLQPPFSLVASQNREDAAIQCIKENKSIIINTTDKTQKLFPSIKTITSSYIHTVINVPVLIDGELIGCISVQSQPFNEVDEEKVIGLKMLLNLFSGFLASQKRNQILERENTKLKDEILKQIKINEQLKELSVTDYLTGLRNRRSAHESLQKLFDTFSSQKSNHNLKDHFTIAMIDIDNFKKINDAFGHEVGDIILRGFTRIATEMLRPCGTIYRWGGEEFLLILNRCDKQAAYKVCDRIRRKVSRHTFDDVKNITISAGLAYLTPEINSAEEMLKFADQNLYKAKKSGKNCIV